MRRSPLHRATSLRALAGAPAVLLVALALTGIAGCNPAVSGRRHDGGTPNGDAGGLLAGCDPSVDSDGDGIADGAELAGDFDGDGLLNKDDLDSDNDGIPDSVEHHGNPPCSFRDDDRDSFPNAYDLDSDNDGLTDAEELAHGTDPTSVDSDGDGVSDFGEVSATGGNPLDGTDGGGVRPGDFFVVLPYNGDHALRNLDFGTNLQQADVYFLIDTTGSMGGPIANVTSSLTRIASELASVIPDVQMGVGHLDDFPFGGFGTPGSVRTVGEGIPGPNHDVPYENMQSITPTLSEVQTALNRLNIGSGNDGPESQTEGLYQTATGEGGTWTGTDLFGSASTFTLTARTCPTVPDEIGTRRGYPCFRPGSLPIIVLVSDVEWHQGAGTGGALFCTDTRCSYSGISPAPHTFEQAADALNGIGARFIGVAVGGGGRPDDEEMARATGSVDTRGNALVFDSSGGEVSDAIIEGIQTLVGGTPQDVSTTTENVAGNPNDTDARFFIKAITPVEGFNGSVRGASPGVTYDSADATMFYGVVPGTTVTFSVDFWNDFVMPPPTAQIYRARIVVLGNGVARLDTREVFIVVPPTGSSVVVI